MSQKYIKLSQREHILKRSQMYIGKVEPDQVDDFILFENDEIVKRNLTFSLGLYKIFDECFQNAIDQSVKDKSVKNIKVNINEDSGEIIIFNDGVGIPIMKDEKEGIYIPEMIFGHLLTSSNYDDDEKRVVGGMNGLGVKLLNLFSSKFSIEVGDGKKTYEQSFSNNMGDKTDPIIKSKKSKGGFVKISFIPDFSYFKMKKIKDTDILKVIYSRVNLGSLVIDKKVKLFLNEIPVDYNIKSLSKKINENTIYECNENWEVSLSYDQNIVGVLSFVNGIQTFLGGKHVDYIFNQILKKINDVSKTKVSLKEIKDRVFVIIRSTVQNPSFSSQSKESLTTSQKDFGTSIELSDIFIKKIVKSGILEDIKLVQNVKEEQKLKKSDGKKSSRIRVSKLEDANFAGTSKSSKCSLILTEGDSAKTFAISGLSVIGRDYYGVFPLRGKFLNVREATKKQLIENEELNNLKKIIGLQQGKEYSSVDNLRYGKIIILTDADHDGIHIQSLIVNLFASFWPSLLKIKGFLSTIKTPIVKLLKGDTSIPFYTLKDYKTWRENNNTRGWNIKYYKGLGTSTSKEAKEYFKELESLQVNYYSTKESDKTIALAFEKKQANNRKEWILEYTPKETDTSCQISYDNLINNQLIEFSIYDIQRSIPSLVDGLKPSQRKVLYTAIKTNLKKEYKVAQFAGEVAKESAYHHGEASLMGTIIGMAQNYVGSNNINLLTPAGQFGTRMSSGKDHASPRYIFTKMEDITTKIFDPRDNALLKYLDDDGVAIEPEYYIPTIPMILVNGASGIGTGFSTNIPCFNPKDIIENINRMFKNEEPLEMIPYYKGFKGSIKKNNETKYITSGIYKKLGKKISITELPIGRSTEDYLEYLKDLADNNIIKDYFNNSTEEDINITIELLNDKDIDLKLDTSLNISNMYLFDSQNRIKKYNNINEILKDYFEVRINFYKKRKTYLLKKLTEEILYLENKIKFLDLIIKNKIKVFKVPKKEIEETLQNLEFNKLEGSYGYLIEMPISSFTKEKMDDLTSKKNLKENEKNNIEQKTIKNLWEDDLQEVENLF